MKVVNQRSVTGLSTLTRDRDANSNVRNSTGVSAASHCVGHGFDVTIFEAGDEKNLGGIWSVSPYCSDLYSILHRLPR